MDVRLRIEGDQVSGELALPIPVGTGSSAQARLLAEALTAPLTEAASELGAILAAGPSSYARPLPGRDDEGRTRFEVRGRREGDRLVPAFKKHGRSSSHTPE